MRDNKIVASVVIGTGPTSMILNDIVLVRPSIFKDERHVLFSLICPPEETRRILRQNHVACYCFEHGLGELLTKLNVFLNECARESSPVCVHMHHAKLAAPLCFALATSGKRSRTLFTVHSSFRAYPFMHKVWCCLAYFGVSRVVFCGYGAMQLFPSLLLKQRNKVRCIPNGVDVQRIGLLASGGTADFTRSDVLKIITVGRVIPCKNHAFMLDVLERLSTAWVWIVVGDGDSMPSLKLEARNRSLEHKILFRGSCDREEVYRLLGRADVFVSPSLREGMPMAVLEAMAAGLPLILSDIPSHRDLSQSCGVSILAHDVDAWCETLRKLALMDNDRKRLRGVANREFVAQSYSSEQMHQGYRSVYEEIWTQN